MLEQRESCCVVRFFLKQQKQQRPPQLAFEAIIEQFPILLESIEAGSIALQMRITYVPCTPTTRHHRPHHVPSPHRKPNDAESQQEERVREHVRRSSLPHLSAEAVSATICAAPDMPEMFLPRSSPSGSSFDVSGTTPPPYGPVAHPPPPLPSHTQRLPTGCATEDAAVPQSAVSAPDETRNRRATVHRPRRLGLCWTAPLMSCLTGWKPCWSLWYPSHPPPSSHSHNGFVLFFFLSLPFSPLWTDNVATFAEGARVKGGWGCCRGKRRRGWVIHKPKETTGPIMRIKQQQHHTPALQESLRLSRRGKNSGDCVGGGVRKSLDAGARSRAPSLKAPEEPPTEDSAPQEQGAW